MHDHPNTHPRLREQLASARPRDAEGTPIDPGDALPFPPGLGVPTMLTKRELDYLHWLGSSLTGEGRVVELGCFLGRSTTAIVEGCGAPASPTRPRWSMTPSRLRIIWRW